MLTKRIIPCLDVKDGKVVKGVNFLGLQEVGDPVELAAEYDRQQADELVFLDITATSDSRDTMTEWVRQVADVVFIPFTVGGGIRTLEDIRKILLAGADKVSLNSAALDNPELVRQAAKMYGSSCIVVAIDAKAREDGSGWDCYRAGGRVNTGKDVLEWAREAQALGAGEILLTSMDADGTKNGFDLPLCKAVRDAVDISVIASGGCGSLEDFYDVFDQDAADAALAASLFHYKTLTVDQVKDYLKEKKVHVR